MSFSFPTFTWHEYPLKAASHSLPFPFRLFKSIQEQCSWLKVENPFLQQKPTPTWGGHALWHVGRRETAIPFVQQRSWIGDLPQPLPWAALMQNFLKMTKVEYILLHNSTHFASAKLLLRVSKGDSLPWSSSNEELELVDNFHTPLFFSFRNGFSKKKISH